MHYYRAGLALAITAMAFMVVIALLAIYIAIVDQGIERNLKWRDRLPVRYRRHPRIVTVQALCFVVAAVAAGLVAGLAPR